MNKYLKGWLAQNLLLGASSAGFGQEPLAPQTEEALRITVHVYNYALAPAQKIAAAERVTTGIFRRVGVDITWLDGPIAPRSPLNATAVPNPLGPGDFILRIIPSSMAQRLEPGGDALGVALPDEDGEISPYALVFYERVREFAMDEHYQPTLVLGLVIAHELGHLLLGPGAHSSSGIMRPKWASKDLQAAELDELRFSVRQAEVVRAAVQARKTHEPGRP